MVPTRDVISLQLYDQMHFLQRAWLYEPPARNLTPYSAEIHLSGCKCVWSPARHLLKTTHVSKDKRYLSYYT